MMDVPRPIRILICDDHPVVRSGLRGILESQPDLNVVGEAADGGQAVVFARSLRPDVVVMDLKMPRVDGAAATREIKEECPDTQVLILTTYESDTGILRAIEARAAGFLLKDAPHEELFKAVREVAEGHSPLNPVVAARLLRRLRGTEQEALSSREIEILRLVSKGVNNKDIAEELWISESTVKSHLNRIFDKLGAQDRTAAVVEALRRGVIDLDLD
jgi:DNA-binding NarL/FixJ family response regulator